jgi:hypothetical protein
MFTEWGKFPQRGGKPGVGKVNCYMENRLLDVYSIDIKMQPGATARIFSRIASYVTGGSEGSQRICNLKDRRDRSLRQVLR